MITIHGVTYDISEFNHPGGDVIHSWDRKDATDMFLAMHSPFSRARKTLNTLPIIHTRDAFETPFSRLHGCVMDQIVYHPMYEKRVRQWRRSQYNILGVLFAGWVALLRVSPVLSCFVYSASIVFLSGLAHNAIHGQFGPIDQWTMELMSGFSVAWWKRKHNVLHHCHTNVRAKDTDIQSGIFAFDHKQKSIWCQHIFFWPLLSILRIWWGIKGLVHGSWTWVHHMVVGSILLASMSPVSAAQWYLAGNLLSGLALGFSVIQSHTAEDIVDDQCNDHLAHTAITTRNMPTGWPHDLLSGYLNYQIEHHLFPWLPCVFFAELQDIVKDHLAKNKLPYTQLTWFGSTKKVHRHLREVSS